jgi:amidophosphoribosyltransferase
MKKQILVLMLAAVMVFTLCACGVSSSSTTTTTFSTSKTELELITRRIIKKFEGDIDKNVDKYCDSSTPEYARMVDEIAPELNLDSLKFNSIETLVRSIGLPREDLCLHCFDGSSAFTLEEENK